MIIKRCNRRKKFVITAVGFVPVRKFLTLRRISATVPYRMVPILAV
ncbi:MAG: hypothetical protein PHC33_06170 [Candidatus Omnitrophica bacterium]|nr:hypothetical protein [Candidatus Omnitrophota bacterium]